MFFASRPNIKQNYTYRGTSILDQFVRIRCILHFTFTKTLDWISGDLNMKHTLCHQTKCLDAIKPGLQRDVTKSSKAGWLSLKALRNQMSGCYQTSDELQRSLVTINMR